MPTADRFAELDATAQAELVRKKEVEPKDLVEAAIGRIERTNSELNAVITPLFDKAREQVAAGAIGDGPFRGVPFLLKDLIAMSAGDPLHNGMALFKRLGFVAPMDTFVVEKLRAAGFVFLGKTNTPELGLAGTTEPLAHGPTRNPWNPAHSAGGSSGGSAAAVAARMVPAAHASDGGGSIRIPSSECGIVGLKPSRARVSLGPLLGEAWHGLATEGVVTRSVRDAAAILDAIAGPMPGDPYAAPALPRPLAKEVGADPGTLRIGFMTTVPANRHPLHSECVKAVEETAELLESLGHRVERSHPHALDEAQAAEAFMTLVDAHTAQTIDMIGDLLGRKVEPGDVEAYTWRFVEDGRKISAGRYISAGDWVHGWSRRVAGWWADGFDLLLTPTIAEPPPKIGDLGGPGGEPMARWQRNLEVIPFTPPFNATGQPGISLPLHWSPEGLPIGLHFVAAYGREDLLVRIAAQLEQARPWKDRKPPISG
jgi:amidase